MKPEAIQVGKTYESPPWPRARKWDARTVLEIGPGFSPYGGDNAEFGTVVRYRHVRGTKRLEGREYSCKLTTFAGWARREVRTDGSSWDVTVRLDDDDFPAEWMAAMPQRSEADARATCERLASRLAILLADAARRGPGDPPVANPAALAGARGDRRSGDDDPPH